MKRLTPWLLLLAAGLAAAVLFVSPYAAFFAVRGAADQADVAALAELVDYASVRQGLREQLDDASRRAPAPGLLEDPIGAVRRSLEPLTKPPVDVDAYLTPAALAALTRGVGEASVDAAGPGEGGVWPVPVYWGWDRVRLAVSAPGRPQTVFTFKRAGVFDWRLTRVSLPGRDAPAEEAAR